MSRLSIAFGCLSSPNRTHAWTDMALVMLFVPLRPTSIEKLAEA